MDRTERDDLPLETPQQCLIQLRRLFDQYILDSDQLFRSHSGVLSSLKSLFGNNEVKKHPMHQAFFDDVSSCVQTLADRLAEMPDEEVARQAAELLLTPKPNGRNVSQIWWLMTTELTGPLVLPYVAKEDVKVLRDNYKKGYRKSAMLPKQREIYDFMCELAK
jgi:hypothetical protein